MAPRAAGALADSGSSAGTASGTTGSRTATGRAGPWSRSRAQPPVRRADRPGSLDLEIEAGEIVALIGRSGSGKSTLLRALAGLDEHPGGQVVIQGTVAMAFQEPRWSRGAA